MSEKGVALAHAIVLLESMSDGDVPNSLHRFIARRYSHYLSPDAPSDIARLEFPDESLPEVLFALSGGLRDEHYYSHAVAGDTMYVVLPGAVVRVIRGDRVSLERARLLAASFKIAPGNTSFAAMFEFDHPEMHDIEDIAW